MQDFRNWYYYDPTSPTFLRHVFKTNSRNGTDLPAGKLHKSSGHYRVFIGHKAYQSGRIVWAIVRNKGQLPPPNMLVVYLDDDPTNLHIDNLRCVTKRQHRALISWHNQYAHVTFNGHKWYAYFEQDGERRNLGSFDSETEARQAYRSALLSYIITFIDKDI